MGKKKFIDKKKSATFQLIARDTSDPNYNEGPSGDSVFVRVDDNPYSIDSFNEFNNGTISQNVNNSDSIFADAPDDYDDEEDGGGGVLRKIPPALMLSGAPALPDHVRK